MSSKPAQTYSNHRRFVAGYHYAALTLLLVVMGWSLYRVVTAPSLDTAMGVVLAALLFLIMLYSRLFPLRAQDRLIRLEETLRLQRLLGEEAGELAARLRPGQWVALRFASDDEVVELARAAAAEGLAQSEIKKRIRSWRPDYFRV